jgi:hypothetical protein
VTTTTAASNGSRRREPRPPELPVHSLLDAIPYLRRPFAPDAIRWKVQSTWTPPGEENPKAGQVVAYIDARLVIARLNLVCPTLWDEEYEILSLPGPNDKGAMKVRCLLTIDGKRRQGEGVGRGAEAYKASHSDALKRATVKFDIAHSIYALPAVRMQAGDGDGRLPVRGPQGKRTLRIEPNQLTWLRDRYAAWLETDAARAFGEPLDHGDMLDAQGDPDVPEPEPAEAPADALFEDPDPPRPSGRKITAVRAQELAELFARTDADADDLLAFLRQIGAKADDDVATALKGLRVSQAAQVEGWIGTLGARA